MNHLQKAIDQLGMEAVQKSLGPIAIGRCSIHGAYAYNIVKAGMSAAPCPICPSIPSTPSGMGNGDTASDVQLYIDVTNTLPIEY